MLVNMDQIEELQEYKKYRLEYEHHLMDLSNEKVIADIAQNFQPVGVFDNQFTEEELKWMYGYAFANCGCVRHNPNGTIFISGNLEGVYRKFKDKIDEMIPGAENSPVVGGNFFITPDQYGLHNDSTRESDWQNSLERTPLLAEGRKWVPWRNIIIPLWTNPVGVESHGVFFKQRHVDFAHVYHHGKKPEQKIATTYPIVENHGDIDFHLLDGTKQNRDDNLTPYDKEHHEKYLYYTPYRRLTGLAPETTCEWKPGCPIVFDAVQLHATNKGFTDNHWSNKMGLLLTFLREVNV